MSFQMRYVQYDRKPMGKLRSVICRCADFCCVTGLLFPLARIKVQQNGSHVTIYMAPPSETTILTASVSQTKEVLHNAQ